MAEEIVILSVGLTTAVGLTAPQTAASVRAGTARFTGMEMRDKGFERFTCAAIPSDGLMPLAEKITDPLAYREGRLLRLAGKALMEAAKPVMQQPELPAFCLALPDMETRTPLEGAKLLRNLGLQCPGAFQLALASIAGKGRVGGLLAVKAAAALIATGKTQFALAGGVDSYVDLYVLATLDQESRVKSSRNLDGFVPGEGAAFVLLSARAAAERIRAKPLAVISSVGEGMEPGHLYSQQPYLGEGLPAAMEQLLAASPPKSPIATAWSSMNGESHWAKEWSVAYGRHRDAFAPGVKMHHPADCLGDTGATSGPLMMALAALGIAGNYVSAPALVYCSSDRGQRAALTVAAA